MSFFFLPTWDSFKNIYLFERQWEMKRGERERMREINSPAFFKWLYWPELSHPKPGTWNSTQISHQCSRAQALGPLYTLHGALGGSWIRSKTTRTWTCICGMQVQQGIFNMIYHWLRFMTFEEKRILKVSLHTSSRANTWLEGTNEYSCGWGKCIPEILFAPTKL